MVSTFTAAEVRAQCERRVRHNRMSEQLRAQGLSPAVVVQRLVPIVTRNYQSGRAQRVLGAAPPIAPAQFERYIDRVLATFLLEHGRLERLAAADTDSWTVLLNQLARQAQVLLGRICTSPATAPEELEFAQAACEVIWRCPFPFDVSFDAWATVILRNTIWQHYQRSRDMLDRCPAIESLDQPGPGGAASRYEWWAEPNTAHVDQGEVREWLLAALRRLPSVAQEQVLLELYFHGRSAADVARRLGRSVQAVYNLKHRALAELRQVLICERSGLQPH